MKLTRSAAILLIPALAVFTALLLLPIGGMLHESFKLFVPGRIGSATDAPHTFTNYAELLKPAYFAFFRETFRISLIATVLGLGIAYPIAYFVARRRSSGLRTLAIGFLITMMFLSVLVRVYSLELTFGPVGLTRSLMKYLGIGMNSRLYIEWLVIGGLLHYTIPMSALTLVGTIQNINPRLVEAAQSLGATRSMSHLLITVPLSARGLLSAFLMSYTFCISAFVIPMVLGKGRVLFVSNLIYSRFSEIANYPSGSAISIVMLVVSLLIVYLASAITIRRWQWT